MRIEAIIQRLETEAAKAATEALDKPSGRDAFEYGRAVGLRAGIRHAIDTIGNMLNEEANRERNR